MRAKRTAPTSLFEPRAVDHPVADDLNRASDWLDDHPELLELIEADVGGEATTGRHGLTCETILRCAVLKHLWQHSYRELEFLLRDSASAQRFARVEAHRAPGKTALQAAVGAATWERIGAVLLGSARAAGVENGTRVRIDSTVTETHILKPADSRLLYDVVRVLTRLLGEARERLGPESVTFRDHCRAAKRRALEIQSSRGTERRARLYRRLLDLVRTRGYRGGSACGGGGACAVGAFLDGGGARTRRTRGAGGGPDAAARVRRRDGARRREGGEPVRAAHGHHPQGRPTDALRAQDQPDDRAQWPGARRRGRGRQPGGQRALPADARAPCRALRRGTHARGLRRRLRDEGEPGRREGAGCRARGVPQEARVARCGHDAVGLGVRPAAAVPGRRRGRHFTSEAVLRPRALQLRGLEHFKAYVLSAVFAHNLMRLARLRPG